MYIQEQMIDQLDELFKEFEELKSRSSHDDISDLPDSDLIRFITRAKASIHRVAGIPSAYVDQCESIIKSNVYRGLKAVQLVGVIDSLRADIKAGYLKSQRELIHGELFVDFLEMAQHLLDEGYKDAAAVIAGSSLESHIRQLCQKSGIDTEIQSGQKTKNKKADQMNSDLSKANVYSKLDQKNVTAWLDLRNKAAHGEYNQYDSTQVGIMITSIRDFIIRNPA